MSFGKDARQTVDFEWFCENGLTFYLTFIRTCGRRALSSLGDEKNSLTTLMGAAPSGVTEGRSIGLSNSRLLTSYPLERFVTICRCVSTLLAKISTGSSSHGVMMMSSTGMISRGVTISKSNLLQAASSC